MNLIMKRKEEVFNYNELSKKFLDYIDVSQKTIDTYKIALRQFTKYMEDYNIINPTREDIINYRDNLKEKLKPTTVNSYMIALRSFFQFLSYEGVYKDITENIKGIKLEKKHLKLGLSEEELEKVLSVCENDKEVLLIKLIVNLGLRSNEVVNIQLEDFYKDTDVIMLKILGKGRNGEKQDSIKVNDQLYNLIKKYVEDNNITDYLFTSKCHRNFNGKMSTSAIRHLIKDLFKKADLDNIDLKSSHSLRHTTVELLLESGFPIQEVSEYVRHKNLGTTMIYAKELNQKESECSNILASKLF